MHDTDITKELIDQFTAIIAEGEYSGDDAIIALLVLAAGMARLAIDQSGIDGEWARERLLDRFQQFLNTEPAIEHSTDQIH